MRVIACLISLAFVFPASALDVARQGPAALPNSEVTKYKHINDIFRKLGISSCLDPTQTDDHWSFFTKYWGIKPCEELKPDPRHGARILSTDSGILNDQGNAGTRTVLEIMTPDCKHRPNWVRMTYDRVETKEGPTCGFELFIQTPEGKYLGVALDKNGGVLEKVPAVLAFDKHKSKNRNQKSPDITSGVGCFECHPSVSKEYGMKAAAEFWKMRPDQGLKPHNPAIVPGSHSVIK